MAALAERFAAESSLELHTFLKDGLASRLEAGLRGSDEKDGLGLNLDKDGKEGKKRVPGHEQGTLGGWSVKGPPHKHRYCVLRPHAYGPPEEDQSYLMLDPNHVRTEADELMRSLQDELFPSNAFRAWLALVSRLLPLRYAVEARRFRRGLDYTLAGAGDGEARLDVVLGLTPDMRVEEDDHRANGERGRAKANGIGGHATTMIANGKGDGSMNGHASGSGLNGSTSTNGHGNGYSLSKHVKRRSHSKKPRGWVTGEWGGWEVSLAFPFPISSFIPCEFREAHFDVNFPEFG